MDIDISGLFRKSFIDSLPTLFYLLIPIIIISGLVIAIKIGYYFYRQHIYNKAGLDKIDKMPGYVFEEYLTNLFARLGYRVNHIGKFGDFGGDLIIEKDGMKTLVQAKRSSDRIREKAIQEAVTAKEYYHCDKAMVVTNNYFYKHAWTLGKGTNIDLWARNKLAEVISQNIN
ncbi:MAG: restriction endonuclease [Candidatus Gottesmanbacteria bacterium]